MRTRAHTQGLIEKKGGIFLDVVFDKECNSLKEILEAVESALDKGATRIIISKKLPSRIRSNSGKASSNS